MACSTTNNMANATNNTPEVHAPKYLKMAETVGNRFIRILERFRVYIYIYIYRERDLRRRQNDGVGGPTHEGPRAASVVAIFIYAKYVNGRYKCFHAFLFSSATFLKTSPMSQTTGTETACVHPRKSRWRPLGTYRADSPHS